ncbi:MAG TPA: hypothetical protein PLP23_05550 [Panacibacter sp.]|nr:hypothetical protein [Panacibacter sp.]
MENIVKPVIEKIHLLISFLHQTREEFELVSKEIDDDHLRLTLRSFALETNQYEQELKSQLQMLRINEIPVISIFNCEELLKNIRSIMNAASLKETLVICTATERFFEKAYRNVLNEYFPYQWLRDILIYQLNSIKCSFMKIKLLNSIQ